MGRYAPRSIWTEEIWVYLVDVTLIFLAQNLA